MTGHSTGRHRGFFLFVAALPVVLGIFRLLDAGNVPYDGYATDGDNTVITVDAGGAADRAGLKVRDRIRSIDGIPVEDVRARARQDRPRIGQAAALTVERPVEGTAGGRLSVHNLSLTHAAPPAGFAARNLAGFLIGLCFLLCGLTAYLKVPNRTGRILALAGLCLGASFLGTPYFPSSTLRLTAQTILGLCLVSGFAALFHFMLAFPNPKPFLRRKHSMNLLYGPAVLVALFLLFLVIARPRATSALNQWCNLLFGLFLVVYFGGAAMAMLHSYLKATSLERARYGLHLVLVGILLGILPVTIEVVFHILLPRLVLPGSDFYYLTVVLIPVALVLAVMRKAHGQENADGVLSPS